MPSVLLPDIDAMKVIRTVLAAILLTTVVASVDAVQVGKPQCDTTYLARWPTKKGPSLNPNVPGSLQTWWTPFPGGPVFNQATIISKGNSITFDANPFRATFEPTVSPFGNLDHVKCLSISPKPFPVPASSGQVLSFDVTVTATNNPGTIPEVYKPFVTEDEPRVGACAVNLLDLSSNIIADFVITNTTVYAAYERLPLGRTPENNYYAFTYIKQVLTRRSPNKRVGLSLRYDPNAKVLAWLVEGQVVMTIDKIGFPPSDPAAVAVLDLGGTPEIVVPAAFNTGLGCFALLDAAGINTPSNTATGLLQLNGNTPDVYVVPSAFVVDPFANTTARTDESLRLFGNGATLTVTSYSVAYLKTSKKH